MPKLCWSKCFYIKWQSFYFTRSHTHKVHLNFSDCLVRRMNKKHKRVSFFPLCECWILNTQMNVWKIHLKMNCLQLMWWQFNQFKMCNSASWAHHSRSVDFGEYNSKPQRTMCTSSIVHARSKALPFFRVGMSAIWLCLVHICPPSLFLCSSTVSFLVSHATLQQSGLTDWAESRKRE